MTAPHERLQAHLGDGIQLGPHAQAEADANPGRAAALSFIADVYGFNSGGIPGMGFGLGAGFMRGAWQGFPTDAEGKSTSNCTNPFDNMVLGFLGTEIEFNNPFPEVRPRRP